MEEQTQDNGSGQVQDLLYLTLWSTQSKGNVLVQEGPPHEEKLEGGGGSGFFTSGDGALITNRLEGRVWM
jgi:hypothetical protein